MILNLSEEVLCLCLCEGAKMDTIKRTLKKIKTKIKIKTKTRDNYLWGKSKGDWVTPDEIEGT